MPKKRLRAEVDIQSLVNGLTVQTLNITFEDENLYLTLLDYFNLLETQTKFGQGILSYEGIATPNNSIFLGVNRRLDNYILHFSGTDGITSFEDFRKNFLNLQRNRDLCKNMSFSSIEANYIMDPRAQVYQTDFFDILERTVTMQQKSLPKVSKENNVLYIGGKTGATALQVKGLISLDLMLQKLSITLKLKQAAADKCFFLTKESIDASFETIIAYLILKQLARVNLSTLLEEINIDLTKNYVVGRVASYAQREERATTKSGKYVLRSLSGIKNKLEQREFSLETQVLFISWLYQLSKNPEFIFQNKPLFLTQIKRTFTSTTIQLETIIRDLNSSLDTSTIREVIAEVSRASSPTPTEENPRIASSSTEE
jgi:hypothetical protein